MKIRLTAVRLILAFDAFVAAMLVWRFWDAYVMTQSIDSLGRHSE